MLRKSLFNRNKYILKLRKCFIRNECDVNNINFLFVKWNKNYETSISIKKILSTVVLKENDHFFILKNNDNIRKNVKIIFEKIKIYDDNNYKTYIIDNVIKIIFY